MIVVMPGVLALALGAAIVLLGTGTLDEAALVAAGLFLIIAVLVGLSYGVLFVVATVGRLGRRR